MYNRAFKYISSKEVFDNLKISCSNDDSSYTIGDSSIIIGEPDILWENICFIQNERLIWTHGVFFNEDSYTPFTDSEIESFLPVDE